MTRKKGRSIDKEKEKERGKEIRTEKKWKGEGEEAKEEKGKEDRRGSRTRK